MAEDVVDEIVQHLSHFEFQATIMLLDEWPLRQFAQSLLRQYSIMSYTARASHFAMI